MTTTLNETIGDAVDTAKHTVDAAKKGTEHAASVAFADIMGGIRTVGEAVRYMRNLGIDDALGWVGLSRRRDSFETLALVGTGILVGAGIGMLLAPMTGADLRKSFLDRFRGVEKDAEKVAVKVKDAVVNAEHKAEDAIGKAKDAVVNAEHKAEDAIGRAKDAVVGAAKDAVDGAENKAKDLANKAKDATEAVERKVDTMSDKAKDAVERKADYMSDRSRDTSAATERRNNNGTSGDVNQRQPARHQ